MAFPVIRSTATTLQSANTTEHIITMPSSITAGDLLIVVFNFDGQDESLTISQGFNWSTPQLYTNEVTTLAIFYKIADGFVGIDDLTILTTIEENSSSIAYSIYNTTGTSDLQFTDTISTNAITGVFYTHLTGTQDYLFIAFAGMDSNIIASVAPSTYSGLTTVQAIDVNGTSCSSAWKQVTTTYGTNSAVTFTSANSTYCSCGIVIHPVYITGEGFNSISLINTME